MPNWPQLSPAEQNDLLGEITLTLAGQLPPGWQQLMVDYRVIGRTIDVATGVKDESGTFRAWNPAPEVWRLFARLRKGMYQDGRGVWFSARLIVDPPSRYTVKYNWENEPDFQPYPQPEDFALEQKRYPRTEDNMPAWYAERLAAAPPAG